MTYTKDSFPLKRRNMDDHTIDEQGKLILGICKSSALRILNGRTPGDENGRFTRYPSKLNDEPSVIDYALCGESLTNEVKSFSVFPFTGLSDHCCISVTIKSNDNRQIPFPNAGNKQEDKLIVSKFKYTYDKTRKHVYEKAIREDKNIEELSTLFTLTNTNFEEIDKGVCKMNTILLDAAKKASFAIRIKTDKKVHKKQYPQDWFSKECRSRQKLLRIYSKDLSNSPFDKTKRKKYIEARAAYKKVCRKAEAIHRKHLTKKLIDIGQNDPKLFWATITKMNSWGKKKTDPADKISPTSWINHFETLLNDNSAIIPWVGEGYRTFEPILDSRISIKELKDALNNLKGGKAPGPDEIIGEYLKIFGHTYEHIVLKLVNVVFSNHIYPSKWTLNFLKPIFKKGHTSDPDNFRGLAIGSALAKLFSFILLKRLTNFIDHKKLLSPKQIGFMKGKSTSDHIFFLQTIVEKVVRRGRKKLYAVFIDFKKAYDTVNRDLLMKRLISLGINGIFLRNIMAMYKKTEYCIKLKNGHTRAIESNLGLKQGCPLSPMLFNLFIDDIDYIFDDTCDPISICNEKINHFLYADDLVILSHSKEGLQRCIDRTSDYAKSKQLTISVNKSKTMIFNQPGRFIRDTFTLNGKTLEPVQSFCYLGFDVKCSGTVKHAMNILNDKGNKAIRPLMCAIARFNIPAKTAIRLFHTYISPILLYNSENWSTFSDKNLEKFDKDFIFSETSTSNIDITHRKLLKHILGVSRSCPSLAVHGETGEVPISIKGYRLTLNFWHRLTNLPNTDLAKKALLENIDLRTNWIRTIEKLINTFNLADKIGNHEKFKKATKYAMEGAYKFFWTNSLTNHTLARLHFYKKLKSEFKMENYIDTLDFKYRRAITKLKSSDHSLEIEKGRHKGILRSERICKFCHNGLVEDEEHFLLSCNIYNDLRTKYNVGHFTLANEFFNDVNYATLGKYLVEAFSARDETLKTETRR